MSNTVGNYPTPEASCQMRAEFTNLDVVVATRRDDEGEFLVRTLQRARARVRYVWPLPDRLPEDPDVVFCDLTPELPMRIPWVPGEPKAALAVIVGPGPIAELDLLINSAPDAVLHRPFTSSAVVVSLMLARSHFAYERRLRWRINKLDESLRLMRGVERAKEILMRTRQMCEGEAYRFMRQQAMSRRVSITTVARAIVDSHELLS